MTTPGGVPNLPPGALTLDTLAAQLQDMTVPAMRGRAAQRLPSIFDTSTGGNALSDLSPFGVLTQLWAGFNSTVANADPADINGPEDLPGLLIDFIESLPLVGEFVGLLSAIQGTYTGDDPTLQQISNFFSLLRQFLGGLDFFDPDFNLGDAVQAFISEVLAPSGLLLTEWNLTGLFGGGLELPYELPGELGTARPDTLLQRFIDNLRTFLAADFTDIAFDIAAAVKEFINTHIIPSGLLAAFADLQELIDTIWQAITRTLTTDNPLTALFTALQNIPSLNIGGVGGPVDIGESIIETWDRLISGLVGDIGIGSGLADLFNVAQDISSRASLGLFSWDILGIRGNKPMHLGILPSSEATIPIHKVGFTPTGLSTIGGLPVVPITQSTALTAYQTIGESTDKMVVQWLGAGVNNLTAAFVNIFKMNTTNGTSDLIHTSENIVGLLSDTMQYNLYESPTAIPVTATDVIGIEIAVRGTGTHNAVGQASLLPAHPTIYPKQVASVRNSGTSDPPLTIPHSSLTYSNNLMAVEFATGAGVVGVPHSPQTVLFNTVGTRTVAPPPWANTVQGILVPSGGGGRRGGTFGLTGAGGEAGSWVTFTWLRGGDFTGTPIITVTVSPGGVGNAGGLGEGAAGGNTVVSMPGHTVTAVGGAGGTALTFGTGNLYGRSPGDTSYDDILYVGGGVQYVAGSPGAAPGGGGAGGDDILFNAGGNGAPGAVWLRFKQ